MISYERSLKIEGEAMFLLNLTKINRSIYICIKKYDDDCEE